MPSSERVRGVIEHLAALERGSCSAGEEQAAEWIAGVLREHGADATVEHERVHGTYWWPLGITAALGVSAAIAGERGWRLLGGWLGGLGAALVVDDLGAGRRWLRRLLPKRSTANVVAWMGDPEATRTLVLVSHHDAAHSGFFFNPRFAAFLGRRRNSGAPPPEEPPVMLALVAGPALAGFGALTGWRAGRRLGGLVCAGAVASFADIALRPVVPGANDNLTGVATLIAVAESLAKEPVAGVRLMLVSTGAEEALMEGMWAFARRHFPLLIRERTHLLCVDTLGSPYLVLAESEGMLQVRPYDAAFKEFIAGCAADADVAVLRGIAMRLGTDGYLALRHGIPAAMLMSVDQNGAASNYHWPTDTPDNVDYGTLADAVTLCDRVVRRLAAEGV